MVVEVDKHLLPMKGHYFLFNAGTAPVVPFIPTLAKQLGYSSVIVGIIYTILPIVGLISKPLFGAIGDRFHIQKRLFIIFQLVIIVSFFAINFIPSIPANSEFHCHNGATLMKFCPPNLNEIDKCMIEQVVDENNANTFGAHMKCEKNSAWRSVCSYWNVPGLCESSDKSVTINSHIAHNRIERLGDCFHLVFSNGTINDHATTLYCPKDKDKVEMSCQVDFESETVSELFAGATDDQVKTTYQFWTFFMMLVISWAGMAVVVSIGDAICFEMLGNKPQKFGYQRLWGSVGWGTFSIIAGLLIDKFSEGKTSKDYSIGFYLMAGALVFDMIVSSRLKHTQTKLSTNILKDVGKIFKSFRVVVFFIWCICVGIGTAMVWNFLFWHLENLAATQESCSYDSSMKTLQGLVMGIQCFGGEVPFFFLSGKLLKKIGHINAMNLVLVGFVLRFFLYSILSNPWYVLPIELLNGVTFGIFYATMASYASSVAPQGTEATLQGLVGAVFEGVGVSTGSFIGGILMDKYGGAITFRYYALAFAVFFVCHLIIQWILERIYGPHEFHCDYEQPYNTIASDAFFFDDSDLQQPIIVRK
ncbi:hypothetical protein ACKWTF_014499 [Chironomus riparius]